MKTELTKRDWEAISAYLDGQLASKQRRRLEDRLKQEPALQQGLDGLRHTRAIIRSQPELRAPRNFTLTPQMAGLSARQRPQPAYPVLRLASVLATIFFVILFAGDLYLSNFGPEPLVMDPNAPVQNVSPLFGVGGGSGGGSDAEAALEQPAEEPEASIERAVPVEGEGKMVESSLADATASAPTTTPITQTIETVTVVPGTQEQTDLAYPSPVGAWSLLRISQIVLAILAVVSGVTALLLHRSQRR